ncbi:MAG: HAMP domain-containing histidine kinase [Bacteroidales bacterium]|nr:HAMP domain-containing histidine kinase [Bacteroidales bacterium]
MRRHLLLCLLAFLSARILLPAQDKATDVFVVSSHVESSEWAQNGLKPIKDLAKDRPDWNVSISYLRLLSHPSTDALQHCVDSVLDSQSLPPRLVILHGGSCFNFAPDVQKRWPGVPIFLLGEQDYYCDIDYTLHGPADPFATRTPVTRFRELGYNLSLIRARPMTRRTINMILTVQPDLDTLYIVSGENYFSKETQLRVTQYLDMNYPDLPYRIISSSTTTTDQLISLMEKVSGPRTAVLYLSWLVRNNYLKNVSTRHNTVALIDHLVPLYTVYASDIEQHTYILGYFSYIQAEYERNVRMRITDVLDNGIQPANMPFVYLESGSPVLNYRAMTHYGIDTKLIPRNAVVINGPQSFWMQYKKQIMWAAFFLLMGLFWFVFFIMRRSMKSLEKARNMAEEASRVKSAFIHNMTHEVRTPLHAIIGFSQLLCLPDGMISEEEKSQYLDYIMNDAHMLTVMVNDMLAIADMDHGNYSINLAVTNLNEVARQALKTVEYRLPNGVTIIRQPGIDENARYMADGIRVQQILINLLNNACKHMDKGEIVIGSSLMENPGYITFFVEDNGPGVPTDQAEAIFERFVKLDPHKQGAGLGLSICRQLASSMGGRVWLDTSYTGGARFVFTIPSQPAPSEA